MIAENLTELREKCGLSTAELAQKLGVSEQTVCDWEQGISAPNADFAAKLSDILGANGLFDEDYGDKGPSILTIWRTSLIVSAVLFVVFGAFASVTAAIFFSSAQIDANALTPAQSLVLTAIAFGALAASLALVMLVVSVVMFCRTRRRRAEAASEQKSDASDAA